MATLINRGNPGTALDAAQSAAAGASQQAAANVAQRAITSSIEMVQAGLECMLELVAILLGWLSVFQAEYQQLHRLQFSPQDLLGVSESVSEGVLWLLMSPNHVLHRPCVWSIL